MSRLNSDPSSSLPFTKAPFPLLLLPEVVCEETPASFSMLTDGTLTPSVEELRTVLAAAAAVVVAVAAAVV